MIDWPDKPTVYPDGKTPQQEAQDSVRMLSLVMLYALVLLAVALGVWLT